MPSTSCIFPLGSVAFTRNLIKKFVFQNSFTIEFPTVIKVTLLLSLSPTDKIIALDLNLRTIEEVRTKLK